MQKCLFNSFLSPRGERKGVRSTEVTTVKRMGKLVFKCFYMSKRCLKSVYKHIEGTQSTALRHYAKLFICFFSLSL